MTWNKNERKSNQKKKLRNKDIFLIKKKKLGNKDIFLEIKNEQNVFSFEESEDWL